MKDLPDANQGKFRDPAVTRDGQPRARVALSRAETLWFNTGALYNITCAHCYIESSPTNDALVYLTRAEIEEYLGQAKDCGWPLREVGFTGGRALHEPADDRHGRGRA